MSIVLMIYLADVVQHVGALLMLMAIACAVFILAWNLVVSLWNSESRKEDKKEYKPPQKYIIASVIFAAISVCIPTQKAIYLMAGAEIGKEIVSNPQVTEVMGKVLQVINKKLDDEIAPIAKEVAKEAEKAKKD